MLEVDTAKPQARVMQSAVATQTDRGNHDVTECRIVIVAPDFLVWQPFLVDEVGSAAVFKPIRASIPVIDVASAVRLQWMGRRSQRANAVV